MIIPRHLIAFSDDMGNKKEIKKGDKFNYLTAIEEAESFKSPSGSNYRRFFFRCDCGNLCLMTINNVVRGTTKSCGCHSYKVSKKINLKHGHSAKGNGGKPTRTYKSWCHMRDRCINPNNNAYQNYGGRGIKVCERWMIFENFLEDMGEVSEGLSLDRIDVNGNYCKENCRWANKEIQSRNRRCVKKYEYNGFNGTIAEHAQKYNMNEDLVRRRINKYGWSIEKAISTPLNEKYVPKKFRG